MMNKEIWKSLTVSLAFGLVGVIIVLTLPTIMHWVQELPSAILGWF